MQFCLRAIRCFRTPLNWMVKQLVLSVFHPGLTKTECCLHTVQMKLSAPLLRIELTTLYRHIKDRTSLNSHDETFKMLYFSFHSFLSKPQSLPKILFWQLPKSHLHLPKPNSRSLYRNTYPSPRLQATQNLSRGLNFGFIINFLAQRKNLYSVRTRQLGKRYWMTTNFDFSFQNQIFPCPDMYNPGIFQHYFHSQLLPTVSCATSSSYFPEKYHSSLQSF